MRFVSRNTMRAMKLILILLFQFICLLGLSQTSDMQSRGNLQSIDTTYYANGTIRLVTYTFSKLPAHAVTRGYHTCKRIYQYDECGNLRNVTEVLRHSGTIDSCHDYAFQHPFIIKDHLLEDVDCDVLWIKPLITGCPEKLYPAIDTDLPKRP